ncbi:MAG: periplasmic heavy metal sensor [Thermodesulfobacteriota bacterium]
MKRLFISTVAILLFSAASAFAQPWGRGMGPGYGPPFMDSTLNLTKAQADKIQKLRESYLKEVTPLQNRLFTRRAEIRLLWEEVNPNREKLLEKQREVNEIHSQIEEKATMLRLELQAVLTPEQRARMIECAPGWDRGPGGKARGGPWR